MSSFNSGLHLNISVAYLYESAARIFKIEFLCAALNFLRSSVFRISVFISIERTT
jgi:hypothetical protein